MFKVSTPAVLRWVRLFAEKTYAKPEPAEAVIVELDEMWHYSRRRRIVQACDGWLGNAVFPASRHPAQGRRI